MPTDPTIPFGYKRVTGPLQKGDGIWNGERFAKVKKQYPNTEYVEIFAIRKCEVVQEELPGTVTLPPEAILPESAIKALEQSPFFPLIPVSAPVMDLDE